ncbi:MAG: cell division protein FtsA [Candidatus Pacebacteria bacterium]|nr:cell division protein FtsA [Candidatus Paceibacterota bacterium]
MARSIAVGIDIGTHQIKVVVAELAPEKDKEVPRIIATGYAESKGLRHGYITNVAEAAKSIRTAIAQAEKSAGIRIRKAYLAVGGAGLSGVTNIGTVLITKNDSEITDADVKKALESSENELPESFTLNRKILHTIPLMFRVDGRTVLGKPQGMKGSKLEVRTLFVTCLSHHLSDLVKALGEADVEIEDVIAAPLATSFVTLTKTQKIAGCVLANIGAETVSIIVFENNIPVSVEVFSIGSNDITNDIALGLKISIEDAELIKLGGPKSVQYPKKKLDEIILARLSDIFELIEGHLKKIERSGLLPAGIIITGGGSGVTNIEEFARISLKLPSKKASFKFPVPLKGSFREAEWAVAYGLCLVGLTSEDNDITSLRPGTSAISKVGLKIWPSLKRLFAQLLP